MIKDTNSVSDTKQRCLVEFADNVIEQNYDIDGVKIRVKKNNAKEYQIWIEDKQDRFIQSKLPEEYEFYYPNNRITFDDRDIWKTWWSSGYKQIHIGNGYFTNGDTMNLEQIQACVEAVENGVNKLKELQKPEIIKIGNVTIERKRIDNHSTLTITGLINFKNYPDKLQDGFIAWEINGEMCLWNQKYCSVIIGDTNFFPLKDFKCTNFDVEKIIEIITKSEEKLARYNWEQTAKDIKEHVFEMSIPCSIREQSSLLDKEICVKIVPEWDKSFVMNEKMPEFKGYRIYIDVPKAFRDTLEVNKFFNCNVISLNDCTECVNIKFHKSKRDDCQWYINSPNVLALNTSFNNGDLFDISKAEQMFCYIRAYLQTWCNEIDKIKVGDVVENTHGFTTVVVCIDKDEAWVNHYDGTHLTFKINELKKIH